MRPRHGDEFSMTEVNSVKWLVGNPPQVETMSSYNRFLSIFVSFQIAI